jgi:hypothetical protein
MIFWGTMNIVILNQNSFVFNSSTNVMNARPENLRNKIVVKNNSEFYNSVITVANLTFGLCAFELLL